MFKVEIRQIHQRVIRLHGDEGNRRYRVICGGDRQQHGQEQNEPRDKPPQGIHSLYALPRQPYGRVLLSVTASGAAYVAVGARGRIVPLDMKVNGFENGFHLQGSACRASNMLFRFVGHGGLHAEIPMAIGTVKVISRHGFVSPYHG
jgi:hypothetical protein